MEEVAGSIPVGPPTNFLEFLWKLIRNLSNITSIENVFLNNNKTKTKYYYTLKFIKKKTFLELKKLKKILLKKKRLKELFELDINNII